MNRRSFIKLVAGGIAALHVQGIGFCMPPQQVASALTPEVLERAIEYFGRRQLYLGPTRIMLPPELYKIYRDILEN